MYKITNVQTLGMDYTISDPDGNIIKTIQIITDINILDAAMGEYTGDFSDMSDYLKQSIAVLTGFEELDPHKILWYATTDEEVVVSEIVEYAISNGYDKIILEHLEMLDDFC